MSEWETWEDLLTGIEVLKEQNGGAGSKRL
jgi:hypothetical protein